MEDKKTELIEESPSTLGKEIQKETGVEKETKKISKKNRVQNMLFAFITLCFCCVIFSVFLGGIVTYQSITGKELFNIEINLPSILKKDNSSNDNSEYDDEEVQVKGNSKSDKELAIEFNNEVVNLQLSLIGHFQNLGSKVNTKEIEVVDRAFSDSLGASYKATQKIKEIEVVEGGEKLQIAAENLFQFYLDVLANDYSVLVEELRLTGNISQESIDNLSEKISNNEEKFDLEFRYAQEELADKYGFQIQ
ncbi:hypothetical protein KC669_01660 [Candidatus Dojkabacteria bacterium]|uniref:Uncharacterized protein n=1 Tax=Candidatus Dojkabacteria bacterium TaxID=2099670 RepID=A0A955LAT6_9BACT|nr:hypothetical protein [Candidatus Dojkabacteria bacterium]